MASFPDSSGRGWVSHGGQEGAPTHIPLTHPVRGSVPGEEPLWRGIGELATGIPSGHLGVKGFRWTCTRQGPCLLPLPVPANNSSATLCAGLCSPHLKKTLGEGAREAGPPGQEHAASVSHGLQKGALLCSPSPFDFNEGTSWQPLAPGLDHKKPNSESLRSYLLNNWKLALISGAVWLMALPAAASGCFLGSVRFLRRSLGEPFLILTWPRWSPCKPLPVCTSGRKPKTIGPE